MERGTETNSGVRPPRRRGWRAALGALEILALVALGGVLFHLAWPPVYDLPPPRPFAGPSWYNPYEGSGGVWLRANFHAHSRAWWGLTYGSHTPREVRARYRALGYDVYALSNYQSIDPPGPHETLGIRAYEHGYSATEQHQTVLGAGRVSWFDFPLYQGIRQKQCVLDALGGGDRILILNHPTKQGAYTLEDMRRLTGYDALEIATKYTRATGHWDAALSAGRAVWGVCADDGHILDRASHSAIGWVMIRARARTREALLDALRRGSFYGVFTREKDEPNTLLDCELREGALEVRCARKADRIRFIGQGGRILQVVPDRDAARYTLEPGDTYVRAEVVTGRTFLYLNPVYRHGGDPLARPAAVARPAATWLLRVGGGLLLALAFHLLVVVPRRRGARTR